MFLLNKLSELRCNIGKRRRYIFLGKIFFTICFLVVIYSYLFHVFMAMENKEYSVATGVYWTLVVMSTLGFGDITFTEAPGQIFTLVVLFSGILFFTLVMPFTFIKYIYTPWLESKNDAIAPRELPVTTKNHVIIAGLDHLALSLATVLKEYGISYVLLVPTVEDALQLYYKGYKAVVGHQDASSTYEKLRVSKASLVVALYSDMKNTNIAATVREICPTVPMAAGVGTEDAEDILKLAGINHVLYFTNMLGKIFARRVFLNQNQSNVIRRLESLYIAEAPVTCNEFVGKTLKDCNFRGKFGLNVLGVWQGHGYFMPKPDTIIADKSILLLAGTSSMLRSLNNAIGALDTKPDITPVLILGGGTVGRAVADALNQRLIPCKIVEKNSDRVPKGDDRYIVGSATSFEVLQQAGIEETKTIIVTTHDDDANIYLTIYCRKLRPDVQILSRANLETNVASLYTAGANLVLSQTSLAVTSIINLLIPERLFTLTEGIHLFRVEAPKDLIGVALNKSGISDLMCNVAAIKRDGEFIIPPDAETVLKADDELYMVATKQAEHVFMQHFKVRD